jgi:hypothetical protein
MTDWNEYHRLAAGWSGAPDADDNVEDLIRRAQEAGFPADAAPALEECLRGTCGAYSKCQAAFTLALAASPGGADAVDILVQTFQAARNDPYGSAAYLRALHVLSLRSPLAEAELRSILFRLSPADPRYLLIQGAKLLGRLHATQSSPATKSQLEKLISAADPLAASEARYQFALAELIDVLLAKDRSDLGQRLLAARAAFAGAEASEEIRPDASMFALLLDLILTIADQSGIGPEVAARIARFNGRIGELLCNPTFLSWPGMRTRDEDLLAARVLSVADGLSRIGSSAAHAADWTNLDAALLDLATILALVVNALPPPQSAGLDAAIGVISRDIVVPKLGLVLTSAVGRRRLRVIRDRHVALHGEDEIAVGLSALIDATDEAVQYPELNPGTVCQLGDLARAVGLSVDELAGQFCRATKDGNVGRWSRDLGLPGGALPIDRPELFGGDPNVDEAVRQTLGQVRDRLGSAYSRRKWHRVVRATEWMVHFAYEVRDYLPDFTRCEDDGGPGQKASEADLKDHLFRRLRQDFGQEAVYESQKVAGGRVDSGLTFQECCLPIEVKHEFSDISRDHVASAFLAQADDYATARDRVAVLMILDLRPSNAAGHQKALQRTGKSGVPVAQVSLYNLSESFWVDALPVNAQIPDAKGNAVIIGLVPGNRTLPSSKTRYASRLPRSA